MSKKSITIIFPNFFIMIANKDQKIKYLLNYMNKGVKAKAIEEINQQSKFNMSLTKTNLHSSQKLTKEKLLVNSNKMEIYLKEFLTLQIQLWGWEVKIKFKRINFQSALCFILMSQFKVIHKLKFLFFKKIHFKKSLKKSG